MVKYTSTKLDVIVEHHSTFITMLCTYLKSVHMHTWGNEVSATLSPTVSTVSSASYITTHNGRLIEEEGILTFCLLVTNCRNS